ncbi:MAG: hypothetical protein RQ842_10905 [Vulcanisaeta sp.]|nr:hypothetical protein [Vulcanisaeta sp.]
MLFGFSRYSAYIISPVVPTTINNVDAILPSSFLALPCRFTPLIRVR